MPATRNEAHRHHHREHHRTEEQHDEEQPDHDGDVVGTHVRSKRTREQRGLEGDVASGKTQAQLQYGQGTGNAKGPLKDHPRHIERMRNAQQGNADPTRAEPSTEGNGGNAQCGESGEGGVNDEHDIGGNGSVHQRRMARARKALSESLGQRLRETVRIALGQWLEAGAAPEHAEDAAAIVSAGLALGGPGLLGERMLTRAAHAHPAVAAACAGEFSTGHPSAHGPCPAEARAALWQTLEAQCAEGAEAVERACAETFERLRTGHRRALLAQGVEAACEAGRSALASAALDRILYDHASTQGTPSEIDESTVRACQQVMAITGAGAIARAIERTGTVTALIVLYVAAKRLDGDDVEGAAQLGEGLQAAIALAEETLAG